MTIKNTSTGISLSKSIVLSILTAAFATATTLVSYSFAFGKAVKSNESAIERLQYKDDLLSQELSLLKSLIAKMNDENSNDHKNIADKLGQINVSLGVISTETKNIKEMLHK